MPEDRSAAKHCFHCQNRLCLYKVPLFSGLPPKDLAAIAGRIRHLSFDRGERLLGEGDVLQAVYILDEGSVKLARTTPDGREQILYVLSDGDFFGEGSLLAEEGAGFFAEALSPVKCCVFSRDDFRDLLLTHPHIAVNIISQLGKRMDRLESALQNMGVRSVDARIGSLLLEYAAQYGQHTPGGLRFRLPLSREGMANYLGIARETVSRKLSQLEEEGLIRLLSPRDLLVPDLDALEKNTAAL